MNQRTMSPRLMIIIAFLMVLMGAVLPFLMVIKVLPASLLLSFISYGVSVGGLFLGIVGAAHYVRDRDWRDYR